jgi:hypothetical protein
MAYEKQINQERYEWFSERVGKVVFRTKGTCNCESCFETYKEGVTILDVEHASYLHDIENELGLRYFDTEKERDEFELKNK